MSGSNVDSGAQTGYVSLMKRWQNIAAVGGCLIVLAFVAERFLRVRTLWTDLSWTDLRDLAGFGLLILINAVVLLAIIVIFWGGYLLFRKPPEDRLAKPQDSFAVRFRHVVEVAVLSVVMALTAAGLSKARTPGWLTASTLGLWSGAHGFSPDLRLMLMLIVGVDSVISFAILWGGYLLWQRARRKPAQSSAHRGN
jgi:hypothetical protein